MTRPIPLEQRQVEAIINRLAHVQRVVAACRLATRDLSGADRIRVEIAIADTLHARSFDQSPQVAA